MGDKWSVLGGGIVPRSRSEFLPSLVPSETSFQNYELEKRHWISAHPEATPAEYSQAMLEIARRCGV